MFGVGLVQASDVGQGGLPDFHRSCLTYTDAYTQTVTRSRGVEADVGDSGAKVPAEDHGDVELLLDGGYGLHADGAMFHSSSRRSWVHHMSIGTHLPHLSLFFHIFPNMCPDVLPDVICPQPSCVDLSLTLSFRGPCRLNPCSTALDMRQMWLSGAWKGDMNNGSRKARRIKQDLAYLAVFLDQHPTNTLPFKLTLMTYMSSNGLGRWVAQIRQGPDRFHVRCLDG